MPKKQRGIQRSYSLDRAGVLSRFPTLARRRARLRDLRRCIERDHALFKGRERAHQKRIADYANEQFLIAAIDHLDVSALNVRDADELYANAQK